MPVPVQDDDDDDEDKDADPAADGSADDGDANAPITHRATPRGRRTAGSESVKTRSAARMKGRNPAVTPASGPGRGLNDEAAKGANGASRLRPGRQRSYAEPADAEEEHTADDAGGDDDDDDGAS